MNCRRPWLRSSLLGFLIVLVGTLPTWGQPETVYWRADHMLRVKSGVDTNPEVTSALERLRVKADDGLNCRLFSVVNKSSRPPSGDPHDYMSFSRYWWPDESKPDGLPYIRRDGVVNRALLARGDRNELGEFVDTAVALCLASYFLDDDGNKYGVKAAKLIRAWFLDEETKMNPHLRYGQAVPGRSQGRGPGIIDTRGFIWLLDGIALLNESHGWTAEDDIALQAWFAEYGKWLLSSEIGTDEREAENNHGSWYEAQVARYGLFAGKAQQVNESLARVRQRIDRQFDQSGRQPAELKRTRSLHYCVFNLTALSVVAEVARHTDNDIWHYQPANHCGIRCGWEFVLPFMTRQEAWEYEQLKPYQLSRTASMALRHATCVYQDPRYQAATKGRTVRHGETDFAALLVGCD